MRQVCCLLAVVFAAATSILVYLFVIQGATRPSSDGRTAILLEEGERDLVLAEMRGFLVAIQGISQAIADGNVDAAVNAARQVGAPAQHDVPVSLVGKLPIGFKKLGFDTHSRFDQLALNIEQFGDTSQALPELALLMNNCTACHAAYRIELEQP